jgi:hypothetical protein
MTMEDIAVLSKNLWASERGFQPKLDGYAIGAGTERYLAASFNVIHRGECLNPCFCCGQQSASSHGPPKQHIAIIEIILHDRSSFFLHDRSGFLFARNHETP